MSITFTKLFSSITESTIWCEDSDIRVVWITMLAMCDKNGRVWASIPGLAKRAAVSLEKTEQALQKFLSPDPYSRTTDFEGRRIKAIDGGWQLLNHAKYRAIRDDEERRAYKTAKQREYRAKEKESVDRDVDNVDSGGPQRTHTDTDTDTDTSKQKKTKRFAPPQLGEVREYCQTRSNSVDPEAFMAFYESNGWKVGRNSMKDWKAAVMTWERREAPKKPDRFREDEPWRYNDAALLI